jgi:SAM-dependent methyltransferase
MPHCSHPRERRSNLFPARDYITGDAFTIERCQQCGIAFTMPRPAADELIKYYPAQYYGGSKRFPPLVQLLQRQLYAGRTRMVENCLGRTGRVLDVGCGPGYLLREFRERGWEVQGTEFSEQSALHARKVLGLPVAIGELSALRFPNESFDAVVMWHVLEHVADPHGTVSEVARILRPGGVFLCAVPNFGSLEARFARDKWFHLDVPRHLNHFTVPVLTRLLAAAGFVNRRQSYTALEYDYFSFTQSVLNRLGFRHNLLYNCLRGAAAKVIGQPARSWQKIASFLLAAPVGVLSVPATHLAALLRTGATVYIVSSKG